MSTSVTVLSSQSLLAAMKVADKDQFLDRLRQATDVEDQKYRETTSERLRREQRNHDQHAAEEHYLEQNQQSEEDGIAADDRRLAEAVRGEKVRNRETERESLRKNRLLTADSSDERRTGFPMSPKGGTDISMVGSPETTLFSAGKITGKVPRTLTMTGGEHGTAANNRDDLAHSLTFDTSSPSLSSSFSHGGNTSDISEKSQGNVFPMGDVRSGMTPFSSGQSSLATSSMTAAADGIAATPLATQSLRGVFTEAILFSGVPLTATNTAATSPKTEKSAKSEKSEKSDVSEKTEKSEKFTESATAMSADFVQPEISNTFELWLPQQPEKDVYISPPEGETDTLSPSTDGGGTFSLPTDMKILPVPETFQSTEFSSPPSILPPSNTLSNTLPKNSESEGEAMDFRHETDRSRFIRRVSTAARHLSAESDGVETIRMKLHPEELGSVTLVIHRREKQLEIRVETETAEAKSLIESQWEDLRQELLSLGFDTTPLDVRCIR